VADRSILQSIGLSFIFFALQNTRAIASRGRQTPRKQCLPSPYQGAEHPRSPP